MVTYKCLPCGGRGENCCPLSPNETSPNSSGGVCTTGLACAYAPTGGGYKCN
jgi:hypothetical protein